MIERVIVKNFKALQSADVSFQPGFNVLVGDNECGKSTLLEAINLALTGQIQRRPAAYELHPFLFNAATTTEFLEKLRAGEKPDAPEILIELYLSGEAPAELMGLNNSQAVDSRGVALRISLDDACGDQYAAFLEEKDRAHMVPTEFYEVDWRGFHGDKINPRAKPIKTVLIDPSSIRDGHAATRYVVDVARDFLTEKQQAEISVSYRHMKQLFQEDVNVKAINEAIKVEAATVTDRELSVGLDMTAKANWDANVLPHVDDIPLSQVGKGEQNAIKIKLALLAVASVPVVLLEEPENHLAHARLNALIENIVGSLGDRQLIATTHSSFVLNKFGVERTLLFNGTNATRIDELSPSTRDYFLKLPGHDTLRMLLSNRTILVEGPSDELIVQKAYHQKHKVHPLADGVEIITVNSLAFKRFLEIAKRLSLNVRVVTDNDKDHAAVAQKYADFCEDETIQVHYSTDNDLPTLEPQLLAVNGRNHLNNLLGKEFSDDEQLLQYMMSNKTAVALKLFASKEDIVIPKYIDDAVA